MIEQIRCLFFLLMLVVEIFSVPHIPQVVYPTKDRIRTKADGVSKGEVTIKSTGSTLMTKSVQRISFPRQQTSTIQQHQSGYVDQVNPVIIKNATTPIKNLTIKVRDATPIKKNLTTPIKNPTIKVRDATPSKKSLTTPVKNSTTAVRDETSNPTTTVKSGGGNETKIVLAPIDGKKVYTLDRYYVNQLDNETKTVVVEPKHSHRPKTALAAAKTQTQLSRGISIVNEVIVAPDLKRTTMSESTTVTTKSPINSTEPQTYTPMYSIDINSTVKVSPKQSLAKSNAQQLALRNARVVSHDTSSARSSVEVRYPAKQWQLPPTLFYARRKDHPNDVETNSVKAGDYTGNSASEDLTSDGSYEEALELYAKSQEAGEQKKKYAFTNDSQNTNQSAPLNPTQTLQHVAKSIDDVIEKTFGEKRPHPKMTFINGDRKKFRATFSTHHEDKQALPLPTSVGFPDETDMDLLVENTRRTTSFPPHVHTHNLPTSQRPVPIQIPGQQNLIYRSLDPNYKLGLCCRKQQVSSVCQTMCNFDTFTDRSLITAVISNQCPGPQLSQAFDCASSKADHTECCIRNNLHLYANGQCMPFCKTHQPTPPNLISYLSCLQVFDTIKNCYREYSYSHPNIFGD